MSFYSMYSTDADLETNGITLDYGPCGRIKIKRAGGANKAYGKLLAAKMKPYSRQLASGTISDDVATRLIAEAFAEGVVIGWEDVVDREGNTIPFSVSACVKLFLDLPELFADVQEQASKVANFRKAELEQDVGNSVTA